MNRVPSNEFLLMTFRTVGAEEDSGPNHDFSQNDLVLLEFVPGHRTEAGAAGVSHGGFRLFGLVDLQVPSPHCSVCGEWVDG